MVTSRRDPPSASADHHPSGEIPTTGESLTDRPRACVRVRLTVAQDGPPPPRRSARAKPLRETVMGLNIVVAGGPAVRGFTRQYLSRMGHQVRAVATGGEMAEACRVERPDAAVCDSRLSDVDGVTAIIALREQGIPVVTVTRWRDRARVRELGLPYVEPPLTPHALVTALGVTGLPAVGPTADKFAGESIDRSVPRRPARGHPRSLRHPVHDPTLGPATKRMGRAPRPEPSAFPILSGKCRTRGLLACGYHVYSPSPYATAPRARCPPCPRSRSAYSWLMTTP